MTRPLIGLLLASRAGRRHRLRDRACSRAPTNGAPSSSLIGEFQIRRELPALRLRQPGRAEGRHAEFGGVAARSTASIPTSCRASPAAGFAAFGGGLLYDTLMEQSTDEPSISHPLIADAYKYPGRFFLGHLPHRSAREMARRQADHRRRRGLVVQRAEGQQPDVQSLLCQCDRGGGDFRSRGRIPFRPEGQSRTAADHRRSRRAAEALVGRHRRLRQEARHHQADAGAAARLGRLQDRELQARLGNRLGARRRTIGRPNCR